MFHKEDPAARRRGALIAGTGILLMTAAAAVDAVSPYRENLRAVDIARISAIILLALVLALRATTGFTIKKRLPELDDELTQANRASAARWGFWTMMLAAIAGYVAAIFVPIGIAEAGLALLVAGAAAASLRFIVLEAKGTGIV